MEGTRSVSENLRLHDTMMDTTTKKLSAGTTRPSPSPFTSSVEHHELTRALLLPPLSESLLSAQHPNQSFIPTAVPIISSINNGGESRVFAHATPLLGQESMSTATASSSMVHNATTRTTTTNSKEESHNDSNNNDNNDIIVRPLPSSQSSHNHSSATQHYYNNFHPNAVHEVTESRLRLANVHGTIQTENEIADVISAQRNIQSTIQYHDTDAINYANVKAAKQAARCDEGLTAAAGTATDYHNGLQCGIEQEEKIDEKKMSVGDDEMMKKKTNRHDKRSGSNGNGGYDVKEYNVAEEYITREYNISDYHSVYD